MSALSYRLHLVGFVLFAGIFILLRLMAPLLPNTPQVFLNIALPGVRHREHSACCAQRCCRPAASRADSRHNLLPQPARSAPAGLARLDDLRLGPRYPVPPGSYDAQRAGVIHCHHRAGVDVDYLVAYQLSPWVFIPVVVNAAAAGGDFIAVLWLLRLPNEAMIEDNGDVLTAYRKASG
jgi:hypothetical protein